MAVPNRNYKLKKSRDFTEVHSTWLNHLKCFWCYHLFPYKTTIFPRIMLTRGRNTSPLLATPLNEINPYPANVENMVSS
jgi:hypothetical protein